LFRGSQIFNALEDASLLFFREQAGQVVGGDQVQTDERNETLEKSSDTFFSDNQIEKVASFFSGQVRKGRSGNLESSFHGQKTVAAQPERESEINEVAVGRKTPDVHSEEQVVDKL